MSPPAWAYQVDNFSPPPDEELICSICQGVFCDPVQSPCHHVFCRNCIVKWLESNRNCPICRKRTTRSTIQDVVPLIRNMIMKLTLCCHNSGRGCQESFQLESCEAHIKECPFELVQCKNKPCKLMFMKRDLTDHELNNCPHSFVRCTTCELKMPTKNPQSHNCIKELQKKLKEKNEKIKKNTQKLKQLKEKLKRMRDDDLYSTASSSNDSLSPADVLFSLTESNFDSGSSIVSSASELISDSADDEADDLWSLPSSLRDIQEEVNYQLERLGNHLQDESVEYPRASSSNSFEDYAPEPIYEAGEPLAETVPLTTSPEEEDFNEEPQIRRPPKRRLTNRILDTSDEEDNVGASSLPSRKRTLQRRGDGESSVAASTLGAAGPSYLSESSTSTNGSPPARNRNRFKLRPKLRSRSVEVPAPAAEASADSITRAPPINPAFERTLSLLEQYNLESDPEWLPGNGEDLSDSLDNSDTDFFVLPITSSDESSITELDSDSSYEDAAEGRTEDLLNTFYGSSDSDSDEWLPH